MEGYIYILTNPAFPQLIKIGKTEREVQQRADEISRATGVPEKFDIDHFVKVQDMENVEKLLHRIFAPHRRSNKEFFEMDSERAKLALELLKYNEATVTAQEQKEVEQIEREIKSKNNAQSNFSYVDIEIGEELSLKDDEEKKCIVSQKNLVRHEGEEYTITGLANFLLPEITYNISGANWWMYKNRKLSVLKKDKDKQIELQKQNEES